MDSLSLENTNGHPVLVMGATNRPDSLDSALRRAGRYEAASCKDSAEYGGLSSIWRPVLTRVALLGLVWQVRP
jgi:ribosome biogenesis ATPase